MSIKKRGLAIFDLDGTLADTYPWFISVINDVAKRYRFKAVSCPEEEEELRGLPAREIIARLGIPSWKMPFVVSHMRKLMKHDIETISIFYGVEQLLEGVSNLGFDIGLISSNSEENIRMILGPLEKRFSCIDGGVSMFGKYKKINRMLRNTRTEASKAIYIGDEVRDINCARRAGIRSISVSWGYNTPDALRRGGAENIADTCQDVYKLIRKYSQDA